MLALAVIQQALFDATLNVPDVPPIGATPYGVRDWAHQRQARDGAREFLTTNNDDLQFWCRIAGLNPQVLLRYARGAARDWVATGVERGLHRPPRHGASVCTDDDTLLDLRSLWSAVSEPPE